MKHLIQLSLFVSLCCLPAAAQNLHFDGLSNSPLGGASLGLGAGGELIVSNIGSSGLDGVDVRLGAAQGGTVRPTVDLGPNEVCQVRGELSQQGTPGSAPVSLTMTVGASGNETFFEPDFSSLGQQTYRLRVYSAGVLLFDQDNQSGQTRMSNNPIVLPEKVYLWLPDWVGGPNVPAFCSFVGGTITPPGGTPLPADLVEFIGQPAPIDTVDSIEVLVAGPTHFSVEREELRVFNHFVQGLEGVHLDAQPGRLKVKNLGSSGQDGIMIAPPGGSNEVGIELVSLAAAQNPNARLRLEASDSAAESDSVSASELAGEWLFTPDFSQHGAGSYTLEIYSQGQLVHSQSATTGPALSCASFLDFYKKTKTYQDGSVSTEWCIGGPPSTDFHLPGGQAVQGDMFTMRSEGGNFSANDVRTMRLTGSDVSSDIDIESLASTGGSGCVGTNYCQTSTNSVGSGAVMCSSGSSSVSSNDLVLVCSGLPLNQFGIFYYGPNQILAAFGNGFRCVGGSTQRLPVLSSGATGTLTYALDNTSPPSASGQISAGQQWNFQCWYRDPAGGGSAFNLSDGHAILFLP